MTEHPRFSRDVLALDAAREIERICGRLRDLVARDVRRRGAVVAVSGGIDSSVTAALAVRSLGPERVYLLLLPERQSSEASTRLGRLLAEHLGAAHETFDIAPALEALGCYARLESAYRRVFPDFGPGWRAKIVLDRKVLESDRLNFFKLVAADPVNRLHEKRLPHREYLEIVAATNFKQRVRKVMEYYHADRLHYAVVGTPNRLEYDQGFFVKLGDGAADVKPIAHLYKTQVYALAEELGLPEAIRTTEPTTDTYGLPQGQDEFYFGLPYREMDLALWAHVHRVPAEEAGAVLGYTGEQMERVYRDIEQKRATTRPLHLAAQLVVPVDCGGGTGEIAGNVVSESVSDF